MAHSLGQQSWLISCSYWSRKKCLSDLTVQTSSRRDLPHTAIRMLSAWVIIAVSHLPPVERPTLLQKF